MSPNSVIRPVITHLKSFEGKQELQADENAKDLNNTKLVEQNTEADIIQVKRKLQLPIEIKDPKLDSIGEQEIFNAPTSQLDNDIVQKAQFTNDSLKHNQVKKLDLQQMPKLSTEEMPSKNSKHSRDSSSGVYETHDQLTYSRRLFSEQQNDTADAKPMQPSAKKDGKV